MEGGDTIDLSKIMKRPEYEFLRRHDRLGKRIILMGISGSHAYGTSNENSDIDLRGVTLQATSDLLGMTCFEQYEDDDTDTVLYGFNKFIKLLLKCNPGVIELLGLDEKQYLIKTALGRELLDRREMFLSKQAAKTFGGYVSAQIRRIQNATAGDCERPPKQKLNKHAMHVIRLLMMAEEILTEKEIKTRREGDDLELLRAVRRGEFMPGGRAFSKEYYDIVAEYEHRLEKAAARSTLPDEPDMEKVECFVQYVNRRTIEGAF